MHRLWVKPARSSNSAVVFYLAPEAVGKTLTLQDTSGLLALTLPSQIYACAPNSPSWAETVRSTGVDLYDRDVRFRQLVHFLS